MTAAEQLAILTAYVEANPPAPTRKSENELAAEDYWAGVGESRRDEALMSMSASDEEYAQRRYDEWLERDAS